MKPPISAQAAPGTALHACTRALSSTNEWVRQAGYTVARSYTAVEAEYFAIRNAAALLDVSPLVKYRFRGSGAAACLDRLLTRPVSDLPPGRVAFAAWCDDAGKVLDVGSVFRLGPDDFRVCCRERHLPWLRDAAWGFDASVEDESDDFAGVALQGPTSAAVLATLGFPDLADLAPFAWRSFRHAGAALVVSRTGSTGDLGYELWPPAAAAPALWAALMAAGEIHGLRPAGTAALDLARIEAGLPMAGTDFVPAGRALDPGNARSPFELGLGRLVHMARPHFNGRAALAAEQRTGSRWTLVGLDVADSRAATDALVLDAGGRQVGHVTSALWSPTCKRSLALASVRLPYGREIAAGLVAEIIVRDELVPARVLAPVRVVPRPFYDPPRRRAVPAPPR